MKPKNLLAAAMLLLGATPTTAQQMPPIPVDSKVKIGHLDNGLTYYIRKNNFPEHVASFYIAQKVGSINENEDQRGLAHLLEHLAFNGTEHFKDNTLQEYLQSIGVEYGRNLNAYTSIDKTVYFFTDVPTTRPTAVDSCMLILKDWSNGISLTQKAIDDERDVVHNEYRMRMVGQQRMIERSLPRLYQNEKYGFRMPIGLMSVIDGCNPETLRDYYRKWYRPDNQAIIVVGDVDVDHIEAQIKTLFADIKVPADAAKVIPEQVSPNDTAIYVVDKDKEQQFDLFLINMKHKAIPDEMKVNMDYLLMKYMDNALTLMLNTRFSEKAQEPDCPYLQAVGDNGDYLMSRTCGAFTLTGLAKEGQVKEAYAAVLREAKRAHDFGFTATEYQRARDEIKSQIEKSLANKDKMKNEQFTTQYVDHFIANEPIPSIEDESAILQQLIPNIPVEVINMYAKKLICNSDTNFVTLMMMQEKDGKAYPTEQQLADIVKGVRAEKLEAYVDHVKNEPLIAQLPKAGKIRKTVENKVLGYKELTLSNGAKVIMKKTDFKDNEILFSAKAKVGYSAFEKADQSSVMLMTQALDASGLGNFTNAELEKAMAGKQASVKFTMDPFYHGLSGKSTPKDIETLMQLIYLDMTAVKKDEKSFANLQNTYATILANQSNNPNLVFQDSVQSTVYLGSKLARIPSADDIKAINYDRLLAMGKQYYGNAKDFTFYFVGNYDEATLLPLIEQYIASLPAKGCTLQNKDIPYAKGKVSNVFTKAMSNPQNQVQEIWYAMTPYTLKADVLADMAARLLEMKYLRSIREELSAAYHAGATASVFTDKDGLAAVNIVGSAQLNPEKSDAAIPCFFQGMKEVVAGADAADLQKVKEILLKQADVDSRENSHWLSVLINYATRGVDTHTDYKKTVNEIDSKQISDFLQNTILKSGNHVEVIMKAVKE